MAMTFKAGQQWAYAAPAEIAHSRIVIGGIVTFAAGQQIACCAVTHALQRQPDGRLDEVTIPFLPLTVDALGQTVTDADGIADVPEAFAAHFAEWTDDPRGFTYFTVPFQGSLDGLIAAQMAALVERPVSSA